MGFYIKDLYKYNDKGSQISKYSYSWEGEVWTQLYRESLNYDSDNNLINWNGDLWYDDSWIENRKDFSYEDFFGNIYSFTAGEINFFYSGLTHIKSLPKLQHSYSLLYNYPNPFNPTTTIKFSLAKGCDIDLTVYNVLGEKTITLLDEYRDEGVHSIQFDAGELSSGVYYYVLDWGESFITKKMMLLK